MKSRLAPLLLTLVAIPIAGCGGGGGGGAGSDADPAKLVPASAAVYVEATIRPEGDLRDGVNAAAKKLLRNDDPGKKAIELFDKAGKENGISWKKDFEPWLGQRLGVFATTFSGGGTWAIVAANTDEDAAKKTLDKFVRNNDSEKGAAKVSKRTYKGVEYQFDSSDQDAGGIVDGYVVAGTEAGFKLAVDTSKGGKALTTNRDYTAGRGAVEADDALVHAWADPQTLLDAIGEQPQMQQAEPLLRQLFAQAGSSVAASLHASADALTFDGAAVGAKAPTNTPAKSGSETLAELPGDAWLAIGIGGFGEAARMGLSQIEQISDLGGMDLGGMMRQLESASGLNIERDLLSWMGDAGFYARGRSLADLGVVFTVTSTDPEKSVIAVAKLARVLRDFGAEVTRTEIDGYDNAIEIRLPGVPVAGIVAGSGERLSIGLNREAVADVAAPKTKLGDEPSYSAAGKVLGSGIKPALIVDFPTVIQLLEGLGLGEQESYKQAKPYLDAIGVIAAGAARAGDIVRARLAVQLK